MRHVIWDWNGTLVDDLPTVVAAVNVSLAAIGEGPIDADDYRDWYTRPVRLFYDRLLQRPVTDDEWAAIDLTFHETYAARARFVPLTVDAEAAIARAGRAGATQSILSMWWHHDLVPEVERRGVDAEMVRIEGNTRDAGETKTRLLEIHLGHLDGVTDAVMIGDATDDAEAAAAAGIGCVIYDGGSHHRSLLEGLNVPVADSLVRAVEIGLGL